jgi:hypothetical protein
MAAPRKHFQRDERTPVCACEILSLRYCH